MVGEDLFSPGDDRVHDVVVFGDLAAVVEIGEVSQRLVGPVEVVGFVDPVELLERLPGGSQAGMSVEEAIQVGLVGFCEMIRSAQERETGPEQVRFICWGPLLGGAALYLPEYQGEPFGEPAGHVKPIKHVTSVGKVLGDGSLIGAGTVGDDYLHPSAPVRSLIPEEPGQRPFGTARDHRQHLAGVTTGNHGHIAVPAPDRHLRRPTTPDTVGPGDAEPPSPEWALTRPQDVPMPAHTVMAGHAARIDITLASATKRRARRRVRPAWNWSWSSR